MIGAVYSAQRPQPADGVIRCAVPTGCWWRVAGQSSYPRYLAMFAVSRRWCVHAGLSQPVAVKVAFLVLLS